MQIQSVAHSRNWTSVVSAAGMDSLWTLLEHAALYQRRMPMEPAALAL